MKNTTKNKVDAYCGACRMDQVHRVMVAAEQQPIVVRCTKCEAEGAYIRPRARIKAGLRAVVQLKKVVRKREKLRERLAELRSKGRLDKKIWRELTKDRDAGDATEYRTNASLDALELVDHPKFGLGVVVERTAERKACILFEDRPRLMVCGDAAPGAG
jgi:hypothetical protein